MTEAILNERQQTHGAFTDNARISQALKAAFRAKPAWDQMSDVQRESLDMIALKLSRILSGKHEEPDHWLDISGYAQLVVRDLDRTEALK